MRRYSRSQLIRSGACRIAVLVTLWAMPLARADADEQSAKRLKDALAWIEARGGTATLVDGGQTPTLASVRHVRFAYTKVADLSPLTEFPNLESVKLVGVRPIDLTPLLRIGSLREASIEVDSLADVEIVAKLKTVTSALSVVD